jgi:hypothetical protein
MFMNDRFFLEGRSQPKRRKVIIEVPLKNHFHAGAHYNSPQEPVVTEQVITLLCTAIISRRPNNAVFKERYIL